MDDGSVVSMIGGLIGDHHGGDGGDIDWYVHNVPRGNNWQMNVFDMGWEPDGEVRMRYTVNGETLTIEKKLIGIDSGFQPVANGTLTGRNPSGKGWFKSHDLGAVYIDDIRVVPEPATMLLLSLGSGLLLRRRKA